MIFIFKLIVYFNFPMKTYGEYKIVGQKLGSGAFG